MTTTPPSYTSRDDDEDDQKSCFKLPKNRVCYSLRHMYTYIGTPNFVINPLWVYESSEV